MASGTWTQTTGSNWNLATTAPWASGIVADGATFTGTFSSNITATTTVTMTEARTIGNLTFSDNGAAGSAWVLAGAQNLTLDNGGPAPAVVTTTAATISSNVKGTAGFTKTGASGLTLTNAAPVNNTLTGTVSVSAGTLTYGNGVYGTPNSFTTVSSAQLPATNVTIDSGAGLEIGGVNTTPTFTGNYSGDGYVFVWGGGTGSAWVSPGVQFTGSLASLGPTTPAKAKGLYFANNQNNQRGIVTAIDVPRVVNFFNGAGATPTNFLQSFELASSAVGATYSTKIYIWSFGSAAITLPADSQRFLANQTNGNGAIVLTGGVDRTDDAAGDTDTATLTLGGTNTDNNAITGNILTTLGGPLAIGKIGAGRWILSGSASTYTGGVAVKAGTLSAQSASAFGSSSSGAVTQTGGTIDVSVGVALNKGTQALTLVSAAGASALTSTSGTNTITCAGVTLSSTIIANIDSGASLTMANTAAMSGAGFGITKNGAGEFGLGTFANTFTSLITISAGTLTVGNLQNGGTASSIGTGAANNTVFLTGTLKYNGTGHSTNRNIQFQGGAPSLDASGAGAVTYTNVNQDASSRTITLTGSSTSANTISAAMSNGVSGTVSLTKSGAGKWVLSNATVNYTGTTTVDAGTLNLGSANRSLTGAIDVSGGTLENSTNTIASSGGVTMTGGTITAEITSTTTLAVNSGSAASLNPTNNANTFSGATTVASGGILQLFTGVSPATAATGRVLGTSNVSVTGSIKTGNPSGVQKGQMRYGGNLTFNSGAKLYIGSAA